MSPHCFNGGLNPRVQGTFLTVLAIWCSSWEGDGTDQTQALLLDGKKTLVFFPQVLLHLLKGPLDKIQ